MQIRAEFDKNKDINDPVKAKHVLEEGEERLNKSFSYHFWLGRREYIRKLRKKPWILTLRC